MATPALREQPMTTSTVRATTSPTPFMVTLSNDFEPTWLADEPPEANDAYAGPSPKRLLLSALGACTAISLQMYASRKQWPLAGEIRISRRLEASVASPSTEASLLAGDRT
jgi:putative redox protein